MLTDVLQAAVPRVRIDSWGWDGAAGGGLSGVAKATRGLLHTATQAGLDWLRCRLGIQQHWATTPPGPPSLARFVLECSSHIL